MNRLVHRWRPGLVSCLIAGLMLTGPPILSAGDPPAKVTKDGLVLKSQTSQRLVYVRPGANFSKYDRVALLDCFVEL